MWELGGRVLKKSTSFPVWGKGTKTCSIPTTCQAPFIFMLSPCRHWKWALCYFSHFTGEQTMLSHLLRLTWPINGSTKIQISVYLAPKPMLFALKISSSSPGDWWRRKTWTRSQPEKCGQPVVLLSHENCLENYWFFDPWVENYSSFISIILFALWRLSPVYGEWNQGPESLET